MPQTVLLLRITGDDRPGLTARLSAILARHDAQILDINQAVIHRTLLLGMMVLLPDPTEAPLAELRAAAEQLSLRLKVEPVADEAYEAWVGAQGKPRYILTLLARSITAEHLEHTTRLLAEHDLNIDVITRLTGRRPLQPDEAAAPRVACLEVSLRGQPREADQLSAKLMAVSRQLDVDLAWQRDDAYRRMRRLVAFDMDSTLIQHEVIDELAIEAGAGEQVKAVTEAAMRGQLDFDQSLRQRVAYLKGLDAAVLDKVAGRLRLTDGAERLIGSLKGFGYRTAIISGGFSYFGHHLQRRLGIDHVCANELEVEQGKLTGRVRPPIVNGQRKAQLLKQIAEAEGIKLEQVIAVGDGANDLPMLKIAGLGIAFHAKPIVQEGARHKLSHVGLDGILYLLGVRDRELAEQVAAGITHEEHDVTKDTKVKQG